MAWYKGLFRCIGAAVCAKGLKALAGVVPFGEVLFDVAEHAVQRLRQQQDRAQDRLALEAAARAAVGDVKAEVLAVVREVCGNQPQAVQDRLAAYLVPGPPPARPPRPPVPLRFGPWQAPSPSPLPAARGGRVQARGPGPPARARGGGAGSWAGGAAAGWGGPPPATSTASPPSR